MALFFSSCRTKKSRSSRITGSEWEAIDDNGRLGKFVAIKKSEKAPTVKVKVKEKGNGKGKVKRRAKSRK